MTKTLQEYLNDGKFRDSTSQGRELRMDYLKSIVRIQRYKKWLDVRTQIEKTMRFDLPSMSYKTKMDYMNELQDYHDELPKPS